MSEAGVLIIDNDRGTRESLRMLLEFEGFAVSECESGPAAIVLIQEARFEVFLIDYRMPDMQGDEVTRLLRPLCPDAFLIGFSLESKDRVFFEAGADAFIRKDKLVRDLVPLIRERTIPH